MVRNKLRWDANNAVGLSKQRNSYQSTPTFLCFGPTALFASQRNLFRTMLPDLAKGLLCVIRQSSLKGNTKAPTAVLLWLSILSGTKTTFLIPKIYDKQHRPFCMSM